MTGILPAPRPDEDPKDGLVRLLAIAFRRYAREPNSRPVAARHIATAALNLLAAETSPGEAALASAEALARLAEAERREERR